jgi:hypothetical protein
MSAPHPTRPTTLDRRPKRASDGPVAASDVVELRTRVERLEAIVVSLQDQRARRPRPDPEADGRLLSAVARTLVAAVFSVADLLDSSDTELRGVIGSADARALGSWLRRLHRQPVAPYRLRRGDRDSGGTLWVLEAG